MDRGGRMKWAVAEKYSPVTVMDRRHSRRAMRPCVS